MPKNKPSDNFEVSVNKDGFRLSLDGFDSINRTLDYVADAVGVVGEPLGIITDAFQRYREKRSRAAAAALLRANEIARSNGRTLGEVPIKFLGPWLEGASSEDLDRNNILELWARLLADSGVDFDPILMALADLCKKIGPDEAECLFNISSLESYNSWGHIQDEYFGDDGYYGIDWDPDYFPKENAKVLLVLAHRVLERGASFDTCCKLLPLVSKRLCGKIGNFWVHEGDEGNGFDNGEAPLRVLEYYHVVTSHNFRYQIDSTRSIECLLFEPTLLGLRFFKILNFDSLGRIKNSETNVENQEDLEGWGPFDWVIQKNRSWTYTKIRGAKDDFLDPR